MPGQARHDNNGDMFGSRVTPCRGTDGAGTAK